MNRVARLLGCSLVGLCMLAVDPSEAEAFEIAGTASFGVFQVGTTSFFAVAPGIAVRLGAAEGINLTVQDNFVMFPGPGKFGFNNQTSLGVGYSWKEFDVDVAGSLSQYWMDVCGSTLCGRVVGLAPGARMRVSYFPVSWTGIAVTGDVGWYGGSSLVLPGGLAATVVAGPVIRWSK